jgi:hypothetical protein
MLIGGYTKIDRWIIPYDSIYCLVNKFLVLNHMCLSRAKSLFQPPEIDKFITMTFTLHGFRKWSYDNDLIFSKQALKILTSIGNTKLSMHYLTNIINQEDFKWATSIDTLRYCEICITHGYHSIFHQILLFEECPIHKTKLLTVCLFCNSKIPYEVTNSDVEAFSCNQCGKRLWTHVVQKDGVLVENLLHLDWKVSHQLDEVFSWLLHLKKKLVFTPRIERENVVELEASGKPFMPLQDIFSIWGEVEKAPAWLHLPGSQLKSHGRVTFGSRSTEFPRLFVDKGTIVCENNFYRKVRWAQWGRDLCHLDLKLSISPIFKSIRRYLTKFYTRRLGIRCNITAKRSWSIFNVPPMCRECQFGKALFYWRDLWQQHRKNEYRDVYWESSYILIDGVVDLYAAKWVALWLLALECLWTFRQALAITDKITDEMARDDILRGRLAFYFSVEIGSSEKHPTFHYWTGSNYQLPSYNCLPPTKMRRRSVW